MFSLVGVYRLFKLLNQHYYSGKLEQPVIVVQSKGKNKNALGWCTVQKIWRDINEGGGSYYEITITAEFLQRPARDIIETLLHEMVHLSNLQNGIQDCSRGGTYHNARFKQEAEGHGLTVECVPKYGWTLTSLNEDAKKLITALCIDKDAFRLVRADTDTNGKGGKKKSSTRKYECPMCGMSVRAR